MTRYMLDTNTCIYIIKRKPPEVFEHFRNIGISRVGVSSITLSELEYGAAKSAKPEQNQLALVQFVAPLEIMPYDDGAAHCYGELRAYLERKGRGIGALDMLISVHAVSAGCVLVTNNVREFIRVPNLTIENWVDMPGTS